MCMIFWLSGVKADIELTVIAVVYLPGVNANEKNICSCDFLYFSILSSTQSLLGIYHSYPSFVFRLNNKACLQTVNMDDVGLTQQSMWNHHSGWNPRGVSLPLALSFAKELHSFTVRWMGGSLTWGSIKKVKTWEHDLKADASGILCSHLVGE